MTPTPAIRQRSFDESAFDKALDMELHPTLARVVAARVKGGEKEVEAIFSASVRDLDPPYSLPDIDAAANRIAMAVMTGEVIGLETDHDCDGVTSHAVLLTALTEYFGHPPERVRSYIGHRLREGYGLSDALADRILADDPRPTLIITADNGSSDEPRIKRLLEAGIDTVVTDHHELSKDGPPPSAFAVVSPARADSQYPDPLIAGVMVAWLVACATRQALVDYGHLPADAPSLAGLIDYVAVGTVADCVSLSRSRNNRIIVRAGLALINRGERACWRAIRPVLGDPAKTLTSQDLAFGIGPRLNATGRVDDAMPGVNFLMARDDREARTWVQTLEDENNARKQIQKNLTQQALDAATEAHAQGRASLVAWLPDGHPGIHGIAASRVTEAFGKPSACISPQFGSPDLVTGSLRGVEGFHVREAMQWVEDHNPGFFTAFGGHAGAGGCKFPREKLDLFIQEYEKAVQAQLAERTLEPVIWTDGAIPDSELGLELVDSLAALEPFGREFDPPVFEGDFEVLKVKPVGDGSHLKLILACGGEEFEAIWFGCADPAEGEAGHPVSVGGRYTLAYSPDDNVFRGTRRFQLQIKGKK